MKSSKSAGRYAQALLDLSIEKGNLESVAADMKFFATVCQDNRDLELMLESPIVKADKKIAVLTAVFDQFDAVTKSFMQLIVKNGREGILPQIAASFEGIFESTQRNHTGYLDKCEKIGWFCKRFHSSESSRNGKRNFRSN